MGYDVKLAGKEDIPDITTLFYVADGRHPRSLAFYKYTNFNPFGESIRAVVEQDDYIVSHYSVAPLKMNFLGETIDIGFAQQAVVHPDYRNLRIIKETHDLVMEKAKQRFGFVIAFSNDNFAGVKKSLFKWRQLDRFPAAVLYLDRLQFASKYRVSDIKKFKEGFIEENGLVRTKEYLNYRFFCHPINFYRCFGVFENNKCLGYIALKLYKKGDELIGHFIDYVAKDEEVLKSLLMKAKQYFGFCGVTKIVFWNQNKWQNFFDNYIDGKDFETNFLVYNFTGDKRVFDLNNYNLSMVMSDAF